MRFRKENINLAPIVLFVYNRPTHTKKTLYYLSKNRYAKDSIIYIYSDGPKNLSNKEEIENIKKVRGIIRQKNWMKEVHIIESSTNKGLANSIIEGITDILKMYDRVIVLEDDIVTSKYFLKFMNDSLELYKDIDKVMHISGYMFPVKGKLPKTFFLNLATSWGWATWHNSWKKLRLDVRELYDEINTKNEVERFNLDGYYNHFSQLKQNITGELKTWAIRWYSTIFLCDGLSLHPNRSFIKNIGFDGTGINCGIVTGFNWKVLSGKLTVRKIPLVESIEARELLKKFFKEINHMNKFIIFLKKCLRVYKLFFLFKIVIMKIKK